MWYILLGKKSNAAQTESICFSQSVTGGVFQPITGQDRGPATEGGDITMNQTHQLMTVTLFYLIVIYAVFSTLVVLVQVKVV